MNECAATRGFTLIEFAIGMFLMSVLLSAILTPLTAQIEQRKVNETQSSLAQISDALMGFSTAALGFLPTYAQIGDAAWIILLCLRLAQGLALGGEYGGAAIYVAEHVPSNVSAGAKIPQ